MATAPPPSLAAIDRAVVLRINELLAGEVSRWEAVDSLLAEPLETLRDLIVAGGKRLRPAFCHWGFVAAGGDHDDPRLVDCEAALELLHTFALLHDDVMDGSSTRRGRPTVHRRHANRHDAAGWQGESRRFGEGVAILVGDLAFVYADALLSGKGDEVSQIFTDLRLEVNVGQYLDLVGTAQGGVDEAGARRICRFKSGLYTVERPLHLGAALAGRSDLVEGFSRYGAPLGEAFQLRDDLLGAFGDEAATGKPVGEDFREGKPTVLHALAIASGDSATQSALKEHFGQADLNPDGIDAIRAAYEASGARSAVEDSIASLVDEALGALIGLPIVDKARVELIALAEYVSGRDR